MALPNAHQVTRQRGIFAGFLVSSEKRLMDAVRRFKGGKKKTWLIF